MTEQDRPPEEQVHEGQPVPEEGERSPEEEAGGHIVHAEAFYAYRGPLPDARQMEHYERVLPGASDRIVTMAESEEEHRHFIEKRGQILAAALPIFFVLLGAVVFLASGSWAGVALAAVGLTPAGYGFLRDVARARRGESG